MVILRQSNSIVLLAIAMLLGTLGTTCWGIGSQPVGSQAVDFSAARLSQIWQEEFPVPKAGLINAGSINAGPHVGMAPPIFGSAAVPRAGVQRRSDRPHPAVARIVVPEEGATSYGSGTLIDVREGFGLVITNWHVVRDATGTIEVLFPDGFRSQARALKVDADWDLAALVVWRPEIEPVSIAARAPRPGDLLTICGYGQGMYRCATGRCTQYYAPRLDFPRHMVELDVEARQGDSGGPIFNEEGDLAGVLFGAGQGTTLGSFGGRVGAFLATLAPDIGQAVDSLAESEARGPADEGVCCRESSAQDQGVDAVQQRSEEEETLASGWPSEVDAFGREPQQASTQQDSIQQASMAPWQSSGAWQPVDRENLFEQMKTVLAAVGLLTLVVQMLRVAR